MEIANQNTNASIGKQLVLPENFDFVIIITVQGKNGKGSFDIHVSILLLVDLCSRISEQARVNNAFCLNFAGKAKRSPRGSLRVNTDHIKSVSLSPLHLTTASVSKCTVS